MADRDASCVIYTLANLRRLRPNCHDNAARGGATPGHFPAGSGSSSLVNAATTAGSGCRMAGSA
jgi:hypothetical protein